MTLELTRYDHVQGFDFGDEGMEASPNGDYVKHADVSALLIGVERAIRAPRRLQRGFGGGAGGEQHGYWAYDEKETPYWAGPELADALLMLGRFEG